MTDYRDWTSTVSFNFSLAWITMGILLRTCVDGLELDFDRNGRLRTKVDRDPLQRSVTHGNLLDADELCVLDSGMQYEPIGATGQHHAEVAALSVKAGGRIDCFAVPRFYLEPAPRAGEPRRFRSRRRVSDGRV